jgi:hypothetical protein
MKTPRGASVGGRRGPALGLGNATATKVSRSAIFEFMGEADFSAIGWSEKIVSESIVGTRSLKVAVGVWPA